MKTRITAMLLFICTVMCACTVQTEFDIYDFCRRFNSLSEEKTFTTADFLSDKNGMLHCFMTVGESTVLISFNESENSSLESVFVTVRSAQCSEKDLPLIKNTIHRVFAAFNYSDTEKADGFLSSVGFDTDFMPFSEYFKTEKTERYKTTLYSNEYAFTVSQEKIDMD